MNNLSKRVTALLLGQLACCSMALAGALYSDPANPIGSITPDAVLQGATGDCYFLSAVASLAKVDPQAITSMIKDNGDGSFTVTFPGAPDEPIDVTLSESDAKYAKDANHGDWVRILEKAYGIYCSRSMWRRAVFDIFETTPNAVAAGGGSYFHDGLKILTGGGVTSNWLSFTRYSTIDEQLTKAFNEKRPATCDTGPVSYAGLPNKHEYSILEYHRNADDLKNGTVTIRNPWGDTGPLNADGSHQPGTFTMTLEEFCKDFHSLAVADTAAPQWTTIVLKPQEVTPLPPPPPGKKWDPVAGMYYNPDESIPHPVAYDGSVGGKTTFYPDGSTMTVYPDGTKEIELPSGEKYVEKPNGYRHWDKPNGTKETIEPDGTDIVEFPDGGKDTELPDGTKIYEDGKRRITIKPDGTKTVTPIGNDQVKTAMNSLDRTSGLLSPVKDIHENASLGDASYTDKTDPSRSANDSLEAAARRGEVTCQLQGDGHTTAHCTLILTNSSSSIKHVDVPALESFVPADHRCQVMMATEQKSFDVGPGETIKSDIPTFCVSSKTLLPPQTQANPYRPGSYPDPREYRALVAIMKTADGLTASEAYKKVSIAPERRVHTLAQLAIWTELAPRGGRDADRVTNDGLKTTLCTMSGVDEAKLDKKDKKELDHRIDDLFAAVDLTWKGSKHSDGSQVSSASAASH